MKEGYIYIIKCFDYYKIGVSKTPEYRFSELKSIIPFELYLSGYFSCIDSYGVEAHIHSLFWEKWHKGEWFKLNEEDVGEIKSLLSRLQNSKKHIGKVSPRYKNRIKKNYEEE